MFEQILAMGQVLRDQRYQPDELRKLARERLRAVLISAFEHTAYYRDAMQAAGTVAYDLDDLPVPARSSLLKTVGYVSPIEMVDLLSL